MTKFNYIDRPPRIQPELPQGEYAIPNPPQTEENTSQPILQLALPMVTILGYILVSMLGKGRSLLLIIPMGIAVVASSLMSLYTIRRNKQIRIEKEKAYVQHLGELRREMESYQDMQRQFYDFNYPDIDTTLRIGEDLTRDPTSRQEDTRSGSRLWERRPSDNDFGKIRLGVGTLPSTVIYRLAQEENFGDLLTLEALRLQEDSRYVSNVSITVPLRPPQVKEGTSPPPIRHALGIAGNNQAAVYEYIRTLLIDFVAFHSPNDSRIYIVGSQDARQYWRWAFPLPHCKETAQLETLCFEEDPTKRDEKEQDRLALFWKNLRNILERRKIRLEDKESGTDVTLPFMLVVVDVLSLPDYSALSDLESNATVSLILAEGQRLGVGIIFLVPDRSKVPSPCGAIIEVETDANVNNGKATFRYAEVDVNSPRYVGQIGLVKIQEEAMRFAKQLEPLAIRRAYGADLATSITLLEMINLSSVEDLQKLARDNWSKSKNPKTADWLKVDVGLLSGNEVRRLVFSAKGDGVHGLVAGSTGSGKSELLMTLIMGLAINYDPSVVNFVLVDYKGGAAFEPFRELPHVVDIVTNLEGSATGRMFASIKAELDRRQRLNTFTDSKDIVHYYRKGLHRKEGSPPYPFLFIIIDEFAEMISGNAEFKSQLESITRLGRALGVHLILAAQRPIGVTDQMRANIKFRICLRVETPDDSRELLRRSDAAFLPPGIPGRGYLQVGNENIEMIQVAYLGGDYLGPQENVSPNVIWLNRPKKAALQKTEEAPKLYDVAVNRLETLAKGEAVPVQWRPWPAFLPKHYSLQTPIDMAYMTENDIALIRGDETVTSTQPVEGATGSITTAEPAPKEQQALSLNRNVSNWLQGDYKWRGIDWTQRAMRPIVGLIDNPYEARQTPLVINLPVGHAVLFGASGWGKTTFLRTLILSLATTHSPDELQVYILDFGGRNLFAFKEMPHVGAIITSEEDERIQRLLRKLGSIIEQRQALLSEQGINDIYNYNQKHPEKPLPAILVVIDNFAEFKENFEPLLPILISLVREARAYGVHFVVTGDQPNSMPGKLFSLFTERMTLKLSDSTEYTNVVGRGVPDMGNINGRGVTKIGRLPLEFQVALPVGEDDDPSKRVDEAEQIKRIAQRMSAVWSGAWKGEPPASIETLPIRVLLEKAIQAVQSTQATRRLQAILGIDDANLEWLRIDLQRQGPHMVIVGQSNSGKTTALRTITLSLASSYSSNELMMVLVDFQRKFFDYGGKNSLGQLPQVVQTITKVEQLDDLLQNLKVECKDFETNPSRSRIYVVIDNYDSFSDEGNRKNRRAFEELAVLAREYGTAGLHFIAGGSLSFLSTMDDLRKQIQASNFGLGLATGEAAAKLNGKAPRSLAETEMPMGRGFIVKSGRTSMVQVATPYTSDDNIEASLDAWVQQILDLRPEPQLTWLRATLEASGQLPSTGLSINFEALKEKLKEKGLTDALLNGMNSDALLTTAAKYTIDTKQFEK